MRGLTVTKVAVRDGSARGPMTGKVSRGSSSSDAGGGSTSGGAKKTVQIMFGFGGDQTQGFKDSLNPWAKKNGIKIDYVQASSFVEGTADRSKVAGNAAPDIAFFPSPGCSRTSPARRCSSRSTTSSTGRARPASVPDTGRRTVDDKHLRRAGVDRTSRACSGTESQLRRRRRLPSAKTIDELVALTESRADGHHPVVHRPGVRCGDRLAGHRLDRGLVLKQAGPEGLRQVGQPRG